jgi:ring-1,2-phenylacetyl-CoA epoxidase subunit PaaC
MSTVTRGELDEATRSAVRDLILVLADTKRLLGYRYAEWMLGAPELETGIACASMAQDEWGHARLLYALLKEFGDDVDGLEHGREPAAYHSMEILDGSPTSWPDVVALMVLADGALTTQIEALRTSSHAPLRQRVEKVLEEEKFHAAHGAAWLRRLADGPEAARSSIKRAVEQVLDPTLTWFGPDSPRAAALEEAGVVAAAGGTLRTRFLETVAPALERLGLAGDAVEPPERFDEARRRTRAGGPDEETIRKVRGDRNRPFLMD